MIKVTVFYPDREGSKFDMDYYCSSHIPLVREKLGTACRGVAVEQGIGGATPGVTPRFCRDGTLIFRFDRGISESVRLPCRRHHGGHSQLHRYPADDSVQ